MLYHEQFYMYYTDGLHDIPDGVVEKMTSILPG